MVDVLRQISQGTNYLFHTNIYRLHGNRGLSDKIISGRHPGVRVGVDTRRKRRLHFAFPQDKKEKKCRIST